MRYPKYLATKIYLFLRSESGEAKFDSALQIVMSFVIGAIVLTALVAVFGDSIKDWLTDTANDWFVVVSRPPIT